MFINCVRVWPWNLHFPCNMKRKRKKFLLHKILIHNNEWVGKGFHSQMGMGGLLTDGNHAWELRLVTTPYLILRLNNFFSFCVPTPSKNEWVKSEKVILLTKRHFYKKALKLNPLKSKLLGQFLCFLFSKLWNFILCWESS